MNEISLNPTAPARNIPRMETIKNTAKLFGLSEYFVRQKVRSGDVVCVKAGCKYLVNVDKFAEYLNTAYEGAEMLTETSAVKGITPIRANII